MRFLVRLVISLAGGLTALAMLLVFLTFLVSEYSAPTPELSLDELTSTIVDREAARSDFELLGNGVIVPVSAAPELLNQCSRETVSPMQGFWRPTPRMIDELEERLGTFLSYESRLEPLNTYIRQYAGVVSSGRRFIYASFLLGPLDVPWQEQVVVMCDGGNRAWGIAYDVESKTFDELRINGNKPVFESNVAALDAWLGRWTGPEGTFLRLEGGDGRYEVTIQNLDGPRVFEGTAVDGQIEFVRDGMAETIHATSGADTGMKWLVDKTNCLTVRVGEGYCRD